MFSFLGMGAVALPAVLLQHSADAGVEMPLVGLGMPCGPTYACSTDAYNGTKTFLRTSMASPLSEATGFTTQSIAPVGSCSGPMHLLLG